MNTLSLFPRNTAQPPLVGKTARTCTSMTVLFTRETVCGSIAKHKLPPVSTIAAGIFAAGLACSGRCLIMRIALAAVIEKPKTEWEVEAAISTYNVDGWGSGYFSVNASGNAEVRPLQEGGGSIDILEVVNEARARGLGFPLVIRFQDLLRHRVEAVNRAFQSAMSEFGYRSTFRGVFPIKVNQLREVIQEIVDAGEEFHFGLEAGSKPELVAALAMHKDPESLIIC